MFTYTAASRENTNEWKNGSAKKDHLKASIYILKVLEHGSDVSVMFVV